MYVCIYERADPFTKNWPSLHRARKEKKKSFPIYFNVPLGVWGGGKALLYTYEEEEKMREGGGGEQLGIICS